MKRLRTFNVFLVLTGMAAWAFAIEYRYGSVRWCGAKDETVTLSPVDPCEPLLVIEDIVPADSYVFSGRAMGEEVTVHVDWGEQPNEPYLLRTSEVRDVTIGMRCGAVVRLIPNWDAGRVHIDDPCGVCEIEPPMVIELNEGDSLQVVEAEGAGEIKVDARDGVEFSIADANDPNGVWIEPSDDEYWVIAKNIDPSDADLQGMIRRWAAEGVLCRVLGHVWRGGRPGETYDEETGMGVSTYLDYNPNTSYRTCRICGACQSQSITEWQ